MKNNKIYIILMLVVISCSPYMQAQCYPNQIVTSTFATGGNGLYLNKIVWLTWGANNQSHTYGLSNQTLQNGETSYASINLGGNKYFCLQATLKNITPNAPIQSYIPGNYTGDSLDDLYNIGGAGTNNQMVSGIKNENSGSTSRFSVECKAFLDGNPVRLKGLVVADAESLASSEEIKASANGEWKIVEVKKNLNAGAYRAEKTQNGTEQQIRFYQGNDNNTAAISILSFSENAYATEANDYAVEFNVEIKGSGLTAIALGIILPEVDGGDALEIYGNPLHIIDKTSFNDDQIALNSPKNLNTSNYQPAQEVQVTNLSHIGSEIPDTDQSTQYSIDALGDDNDGGSINEEDALPAELKRFSHENFNYKAEENFEMQVPYYALKASFLQGWIDFNLNGVFETSEGVMVEVPAGTGTATLNWVVPNDVVLAPTYVRLRLSENYYGNLTPEATLLKGEIEDHRMYVVKPVLVNPSIPSVIQE
ncbi:CshA/CshB family fibrillar adhesin-related protein [Mesonia aestuariivivens]|uniref:Uncharacterized protein n=1 Tax=Mesonia aestuariivivens TaxID=2796128 RepID=A0ABS6W4G6_9FLAO|nr:CshA/CshB family fibrillar adhesin-related protein [Mesonia aestuariivivens]MBW2962381.1 hypothetical protein [Mesonia aestuariivivens]